MIGPLSTTHGCSALLVCASSLYLILLLGNGCTEASMYHIKGICKYKDKYFKQGDSFRRSCDKCFCHEFGFYCFPPMKPTSWPKKCHRIRRKCGYRVVYKDNPLVECRAYSWIG